MTINTTCVECGQTYSIEITDEQYACYKAGNFTQVAFPDMKPEDRELHFISGICGRCWDAMFSEEE